jgi:hypothetical protein
MIPILALWAFIGCDGPAATPSLEDNANLMTAALEGSAQEQHVQAVASLGDEVPLDQQVTSDPPAPMGPVAISYDPGTVLAEAAKDPKIAAALATMGQRQASGERATVAPQPRDEEHCTTGVEREGSDPQPVAPAALAVATAPDRSDVPLMARLTAAPASDLVPSPDAVVGPAEPTPFSY